MILYILIGLIKLFNKSQMETISPSIQEKKVLPKSNSILENTQNYVKVHAAEHLIWTGHSEASLKEFLKEEKIYSNEPHYRIIIWRGLVQAERDLPLKKIWLNKIFDAYNNMGCNDRTHVTESLAKLKKPLTNLFPQVTAKTLASSDRTLHSYALWTSLLGFDSMMDMNRIRFIDMALKDTNLTIRKIRAYFLRQLKGLNLQLWEQLTSSVLSLDKTDETYVSILTSSLITAPAGADSNKLSQINDLLIKEVKNYTVGQFTELSQALAKKIQKKHLKILQDFNNNENLDRQNHPSSDELPI